MEFFQELIKIWIENNRLSDLISLVHKHQPFPFYYVTEQAPNDFVTRSFLITVLITCGNL